MSKRLKFSLIHLSVSAIFALFIISLVFLVWYVTPLSKAVDVTHIFLMILAIDVILGPTLSFIVYKEGKKSLKFDLFVIILIQLSALIYGIYTIEQGRPVWLVYNVDRFELIRKNELISDNINQVKTPFKNPPMGYPQYIGVLLSKNIKQKNEDLFIEVMNGVSIAHRPERYVPLEKVKPQIQQRAQVLSLLNEFNAKEDVNTIIKKYPQADSWVPLKANAVDMVVLINKKKGEVVKIVDLRPWK
ncbi:TfpX/TfpZ family type IV pilin accessory protein [Acinetobacter sichuanensis]|uniref:TfpX/TfpZ family type IV pilin accessory protein n=1 Tax=Acinetobacter sichuanensis TaxID=2136183 RepID=UPI00280DCFDF|nr:TfpX/TfpZ family type IV pilin accessory protein [Acinetobacter sichuanensis]MDQ9020643.1 TfpX/TfpZ family type IV pilin accessory protein [Acinetobacter sichuanensis]